MLYDTGYADHFHHETRTLPNALYRWITPVQLAPEQHLSAQLARLGVEMRDIKRVLISHFHADHVAGLRDLPSARFTALDEDVTFCLGHRGLSALRRGLLHGLLPDDFSQRLDLANARPIVSLDRLWKPFTHGFDLMGDGSLIAVRLPGHSPAQMGLIAWTLDGPVMLVADASWSSRAMRENRMPSMLARPTMHQWSRYRTTLRQLHDLTCAHPEIRMLPSHCREAGAAWNARWHQAPHHHG
jgi:glyoxylase-like metal-dependent hydrolase (beta-lactamase superfamily II)